MEQDLIVRFRRLFRGRQTAHGLFWPDPGGDPEKKRVKTVDEPVPEEAWERHLMGEVPFLGIVPLTSDNTCYFGAIDYDDECDTHEFEERVRMLELPLVVCRSKSGGAHLYAFFSEPVPGAVVIERLKEWRNALGIERNLPDHVNKRGRQVEVFPKQARLRPSEQGNWINLPYFGGSDTNRYAVFRGERLSLEDFLTHAESMRMSEASFTSVRAGADPFEDGPPCLQDLNREGVPSGARNNALFNFAIFYKLSNPDGWQDDVRKYNEGLHDPLDESEVELVIRSVGSRDYVYKCSDAPIESYCKKGACNKRKFGIKGFHDAQTERKFPELTDLQRINTDPPLWRVKVGGRPVQCQTDDLMQLGRFRKVALEQLNVILPQIKPQSWDAKLSGLLEKLEQIDAPADAGVGGEFKYLLAEFLITRLVSRTREDLLRGKPFQEGERVLFRSPDLIAYLRRRGFREYSNNRVYTVLRDMGAEHDQVKISGTNVQVWSLSTPREGDEQSQEFEMPSRNGGVPRY